MLAITDLFFLEKDLKSPMKWKSIFSWCGSEFGRADTSRLSSDHTRVVLWLAGKGEVHGSCSSYHPGDVNWKGDDPQKWF